MHPYLNHNEYLCGISELSQSQNPAADYEILSARESITMDVFMPVMHLKNIFHPESDLYFYMAVARALNGGNIFTDNADIPLTQKHALRVSIGEILEDNGDFKQRILDFIYNPDDILDRPWITYGHSALSESDDIILTEEIKYLSALTRNFMSENAPHFIWVSGRNGSGRKTTVLFSCPMPVLLIDACQISGPVDLESIKEIILESRLIGAVLCFCDAEGLFECEKHANMLIRLLERSSRVTFFTTRTIVPDICRTRIRTAEINIPLPDGKLALKLWEKYSRRYQFDEAPDYNKLASVFKLTPFQISCCVENTFNLCIQSGRNELSMDDLYKSCRLYQTIKLPLLGQAVKTSFKWNDLILPDDIKSTLNAVVERIINKSTVFGKWGFGEKSPYGQGVALLLEGAPGTGKTMAAHVLAERLALPMYKIDISAIMSKYIGETEKNLQTLFDEANGIECVLFFDEAEALFSKRTDITDSKDKYSNLEISFLLQKLEERPGLTILASNLMRNFDDAFMRRFHFIIRIPSPDKEQRKKIWQSVFPTKAPVSSDIDFEYLSDRYELNGSSIKNIVLSAAFKAVTDNTPIGMSHLMSALKEETSKSGIALY